MRYAFAARSILAVVVVAAGCGPVDEAELAVSAAGDAPPPKVVPRPETAQELYAASSKTWGTHTVHVCWMTGGYATEKGWVRDAVAKSWSRVANITFDDWGTCPTNALQPYWPYANGIRIRIADENPRTSGLGEDLDDLGEQMTLNFSFATWSHDHCSGSNRESCIRVIAAHEFGHGLGFAHEQNRPDTDRTTCTDAPQGTNGDLMLGGWDLRSIMNYCNPDWNNEHLPGYLSEGDVAGVRQVYGTRGDAFASPIAVTLEAGETTVLGSTLKATNDGPLPGFACASGPNVWYSVKLTRDEVLYADTAGSGWDTALHLVDSSGAVVAAASNDDSACTGGDWKQKNGYESRIAAQLSAGTYKLAVSGCGSGNFTLRLQHLPVALGAYFEGRISGSSTASTYLTGASVMSSACGGGASGEDVRWFLSCGGQRALFSLCQGDGGNFSRASGGVSFDPAMYLWSGATASNGACNDDGGASFTCSGFGGDGANYGSRLDVTVGRGLSGLVVDERIGGTPNGHGLDYTLAYSVP